MKRFQIVQHNSYYINSRQVITKKVSIPLDKLTFLQQVWSISGEIRASKMALYCPQGNGTLRQQLLMMHDIAWYCIVLHSIAWYCMVLHGMHGVAWYCMVLHCIAFHCMVLHGMA